MTGRRKLISIKDYNTTISSLSEFGKKIRGSLRPIIFEINSIQELRYEALRLIKPISKRVKNNPESINREVDNLINIFKLNTRQSKYKEVTTNDSKNYDESNSMYMFELYFLGYSRLPKNELKNLKSTVELHLVEINSLIKKYESLPEIINNGRSRDHRTKTIQDFYLRVKIERQLILDYYLDGVYDKALSKCRTQMKGVNNVYLEFFSQLDDFPYELGKGGWGRTLNHEKIKCVDHRIDFLNEDQFLEWRDIYKVNKSKFYKLLFHERGSDEIFKNIFHGLKYIPLKNDRKQTFKALEKLFNANDWLAFFALALPQVEGLFSEMIHSEKPNSVVISKSLSVKVNSLRKVSYHGSDSFDYFEYVLPEIRNSFSHTGHIDNAKEMSNDLLTDLEHLINLFKNLDNPLVRIRAIMTSRDVHFFSSPNAYAEFFVLIKELPDRHSETYKKDITEFLSSFLIRETFIDHFITRVIDRLEILPEELEFEINSRFNSYFFIDEFGKLTKPKIQQLGANKEFIEALKNLILYKEELVKECFMIKEFISGINLHIKHTLNYEDLISELNKAWKNINLKVKDLDRICQLVKK